MIGRWQSPLHLANLLLKAKIWKLESWIKTWIFRVTSVHCLFVLEPHSKGIYQLGKNRDKSWSRGFPSDSSGAFVGGQIFFRSKSPGRHVSYSTFSYLHCTPNISLNWNTRRLLTLRIRLCQWVEESWSFRKFGHASILPVKSHWTINMLTDWIQIAKFFA